MVRTIAKDHDDKRRHILSVAAEVFARQGIARASMNEVASACGISKANIYHYYDSKDVLLFDILDSYLASLRDRLCGLDLDGRSPSKQLHSVTREILLAYDGMDNEHRIQSEGLPLLGMARQQVLKNYQRDMVRFVSDVLTRIAPDRFAEDASHLRNVTMSVFGMLNWFYQWNAGASPDDRLEYARVVADLTLNGLQD